MSREAVIVVDVADGELAFRRLHGLVQSVPDPEYVEDEEGIVEESMTDADREKMDAIRERLKKKAVFLGHGRTFRISKLLIGVITGSRIVEVVVPPELRGIPLVVRNLDTGAKS